jgi:hypothetical protein
VKDECPQRLPGFRQFFPRVQELYSFWIFRIVPIRDVLSGRILVLRSFGQDQFLGIVMWSPGSQSH